MGKEVPMLVGEDKNDIMKFEEPFKIEWHGTGSKIVSQLSKADSML